MACTGLVGGTTEQSCIFPDLLCYYQWYETLSNCLHHTSAVPQPFLLLMGANLAQAGCLFWKCSFWPVPTWLAVQRSRAVFFLTIYYSINDMKHFWNVSITLQLCHIYFCCSLLPIWLKMDVYTINDMMHFRTFHITPHPALVCFQP